jgi:hypothetical protein
MKMEVIENSEVQSLVHTQILTLKGNKRYCDLNLQVKIVSNRNETNSE